MKILFIIALLSFFALACAVFAITRHIRKNAGAAANPQGDLDLSQAIGLRLDDLARPPKEHRPVAPPSGAQDFAYFNKEKPLPEPPKAAAERP